jgi:hypothetical protein
LGSFWVLPPGESTCLLGLLRLRLLRLLGRLLLSLLLLLLVMGRPLLLLLLLLVAIGLLLLPLLDRYASSLHSLGATYILLPQLLTLSLPPDILLLSLLLWVLLLQL